MSTAVIILNYNNLEDTINCVQSIKKYNTSSIKLIVVDNASSYECQNQLKNYLCSSFVQVGIFQENASIEAPLSNCSFITCQINKGYAQGNNEGIYLALQDTEIEYIMILNNDILFTEDIIPKLCLNANSLPNAALVSPLLYKKDGKTIDYNCARFNHSVFQSFTEYLSYFGDIFGIFSKISNKRKILLNQPSLLDNEIIEIELPSGSCMLAKKSLYKEIDAFDPNTFLYYEENILFEKIKSKGMTNYMLLNNSCIHLGASTIKGQASPHMVRYSTQSARYYLFHYKRIPATHKILFNILCSLSILKTDILYFFRNLFSNK